jgi:biopolymer transport protein ExbB/TolQ
MSDWFRSGGYSMWPIVVAAVLVVISSIRSWLALRSDATQPESVRGAVDGVLFWGGFAATVGVLGTVVGVAQAARAIGAAGSASPALVWSGLGVTLVTSMFGLTVLLVSLLLWYALRVRARRHV